MNLDRLVEENAEYLFAYARRRINNQEDAEELVQECFVAAVKGWDRFRRASSERTWLVAILKNKLLDYYRSKARAQSLFAEVPAEGELERNLREARHWNSTIGPRNWDEDPARLTLSQELFETLQRCLEELPGRAAAIFEMRAIDGQSSQEIRAATGVTAENLRTILHRAQFSTKTLYGTQLVFWRRS